MYSYFHLQEGVKISRENIKVPLFADDLFVFLKDVGNDVPAVLDIVNNLACVSGYRINCNKSEVVTFSKKVNQVWNKGIYLKTSDTEMLIEIK